MDARYKVRIMEGVLEKAVTQAVLVMNQQLSRVSPDLVQLTGSARARGYRLDNYGVFFEVEVPAAMQQTMGWTVRMLREVEGINQAIGSLRQVAGSLDGKARTDAELAVRQIEAHIRPALGPTPVIQAAPSAGPPSATAVQATGQMPAGGTPQIEGTPAGVPAPAAPGLPAPNPLLLQNPDLAYEIEVREALISAMLDFGGLLPLAADEWLTVAARDNQDVIIPGDLAEVVTVIMRVKGSDLAEFKAGRLTADDVRKRVEVREF